MVKQLVSKDIKDYLATASNKVLLDVRTQGELDSVGKPDGDKIGLKTYILEIKRAKKNLSCLILFLVVPHSMMLFFNLYRMTFLLEALVQVQWEIPMGLRVLEPFLMQEGFINKHRLRLF